MQTRKQEIIDAAIQLFSEQGYHATSVQDILNRCNISKGTFYKYYQSKGELLRATLLYIDDKINMERDRILTGEDVSNKDIFVQQLVAVMTYRKEYNLSALIEDALASNDDADLIAFIKQLRMRLTSWSYLRFQQIFPKYYEVYLLDATLAFKGMLQSMMFMNAAISKPMPISTICQYSLARIEELLTVVEQKQIRLFQVEELDESLLKWEESDFSYKELALSTGSIRKLIEKRMTNHADRQQMAYDLTMFIQEEVAADSPKKSVIESAMTTLMHMKELNETPELLAYFNTLDKLGFQVVSE